MARKLITDSGDDDEVLADTVRSTAEVMAAADGRKVRSGAWWKGRAKILGMTKKTAAGKKLRSQLFKRLNEDGDSTVTLDELNTAILKMWPEFDNSDCIKRAYEAADRDGGGVQAKELRLLLQYLVFYDDAWEIFRDMDVNADGALSEREFVTNIDRIGIKLKSPPAAVFTTMDIDGNNSVDLQEFSLWLGRIKFAKDAKAMDDVGRAFGEGDDASDAAVANAHVGSFEAGLEAGGISAKVIAILVENGITDAETLGLVEPSDLTHMGIAMGIGLKLRKIARTL